MAYLYGLISELACTDACCNLCLAIRDLRAHHDAPAVGLAVRGKPRVWWMLVPERFEQTEHAVRKLKKRLWRCVEEGGVLGKNGCT